MVFSFSICAPGAKRGIVQVSGSWCDMDLLCISGGEVPLPVVWGLTVLHLRFFDGGGVPASPPSYTLQKMCKLIEEMIVILIIYCKVEYW